MQALNCADLEKLFSELKEAQDEERTAIKRLDLEELAPLGDRIQILLDRLAERLEDEKNLPVAEAKRLLTLLSTLRENREKNRMLLSENMIQTGSAIEKITRGKTAFRAYHTNESSKALFLKKDC